MSPADGNAIVQGLYAGVLGGILPRLAAVVSFALAVKYGVRTGNMAMAAGFLLFALFMTFGGGLLRLAGF